MDTGLMMAYGRSMDPLFGRVAVGQDRTAGDVLREIPAESSQGVPAIPSAKAPNFGSIAYARLL